MLKFDEFELDEDNALLTRAGNPVQLPPRAFAVLCTLVRGAGKLTRKDDLLDAVWGHRHVSESVLKSTISQLRAALEDDAARPRYIETASRRGYRFIGAIVTPQIVSQAAPARPSPVPERAPAASEIPEPSTPTLIGRKAALARLHDAWKRASAGKRELVWIAGDPGVGKTTLIEHFVREVNAPVVSFGQCVEQFGAGEPYLPILEALGSLCRRFPDLPPLLRSMAPTWLVQLPWLVGEAERSALNRELAGTSPERMLRELTECIGRFTQKEPLLLVTEDLHWADLATLRMMARFARITNPTRVLWLGSLRLTQVIAEEHPLVDIRSELRLHKLHTEIVLEPFSEDEVGEYIGSRMPDSSFPEAFVQRVHSHTDGLPLFLANVVDSLLQSADAQGGRTSVDTTAATPLPIPDSLIAALDRQISRLPAHVRTILEAGSVCGVEFRASTVANAVGQDAAAICAHCDYLVRRKLWLRHAEILELPDGTLDSRYVFEHALHRRALYERIGLAQRVQQHRRVARSLEANRAQGFAVPATELATHRELGHEFAAAVRAYAEAAQAALGVFATQAALDLTGHALTLLPRCPEGAERSELELALAAPRSVACATIHGIASSEAREASERVRALCDVLPQTPARAVTLNGLGWVHYTRGEYPDTLALARRLHDISVAHADPVLFVFACNLLGVTLGVTGDHVGSQQWLERGLATSAQLGDAPALALLVIDPEVSMRSNIAMPLMHLGLADQARTHVQLALERAQQIGQPMARMLAHWTSGMVGTRLNAPAEVAANAAGVTRVVQQATLAQGEGPGLWLRGWAEAHLGDPRRGHELIMEGYGRHERHGMYAGCTEVLGYAVDALILAQRWDEADRQVDEALEMGERIGERSMFPNLLDQRARIALGRNDRERALRALEQAASVARGQQALWYELVALAGIAEIDGSPANRDALAACDARMAEGRDTKLSRRVSAILVPAGAAAGALAR